MLTVFVHQLTHSRAAYHIETSCWLTPLRANFNCPCSYKICYTSLMADNEALMTPKLLDALYTESMVLADEARSYFESGRFNDECPDQATLSVAFSCESLKVTTRLMHCIAWLLNQRALHSEELTDGEAWNHDRELGFAAASDGPVVEMFPEEARQIIDASEELFMRLERLSDQLEYQQVSEPPVHDMFRRLQSSF